MHACLEGPEAGVYYRGEATIENNKSFLSDNTGVNDGKFTELNYPNSNLKSNANSINSSNSSNSSNLINSKDEIIEKVNNINNIFSKDDINEIDDISFTVNSIDN